jgi:C4-dicarboxylate-specific signal transduction histidine kinase
VGRMVSGVAHELNNPLQTVVGNAEMLAAMKLTDAARRRAQRVLSGARRCQEVVDGLVKLVRKHREVGDTVQLEEVVRRVARRIEGEYGERQVVPKLVVDAVPAVRGSAADLEQALENILRNACQAVVGMSDPEVEIRVERVGRLIQVAVRDNGSGLTPEVRDRAFEPFFTTRGVGAGKGLGLSIALGIVEEHGGMIELQPLERGTRVLVVLPLAGAEPG